MSGAEGLVARGVLVRYGGTVAVDDVSLAAPRGRVTGLIGPNGAGKTSMFNACSGFVPCAAGTVSFDGHDITRLRPAERARRGLGRTFQRIELCNSLTVAENVQLGRETRLAGRSPWRQVVRTREEKGVVAAAVDDALERCGLTSITGKLAGALSTGERRLVELARAHAAGFSVLLLDEPSSGLDPAESAALGRIVRDWADESGRGVLLVEHDMALVLDICEYLYVLDFGRLIYEGTAAEVSASPVVQAAYLGSAAALAEHGIVAEGAV
jgi:ABC-type branched-subunit amino acid transport system ATPase component